MPFDAKRYEETVLKPLRGATSLPDDLLVRYAIEPGMTADQLTAHLRRVRSLWNQKAGATAGSLPRLCKLLLSADEELQRQQGERMLDPTWWRNQERERTERTQKAVAQLAADLRAAFGSSGTVTRTQLDEIAKHAALTPAAVFAASTKAGLRVVEAVPLPDTSGLERTAYNDFCVKLAESGARTVVQLLHPDLSGPFRIVREFRADADLGACLDKKLLDDQLSKAERVADSPVARARKAALGLLRTAVAQSGDIRLVALYHLADQVGQKRAQGLPEPMLVTMLTRLGVHPDEAVLLVASVPQGTRDTAAKGANRVSQLLGAGELRQAQRILAGLAPSAPGYSEARQAVEAADAAVTTHLTAARTAAEQNRFADAEREFQRAAELALDDEAIVQLWQRLPPPPPGELTAAAVPAGVRLAWRPDSAVAGELTYRVRRGRGRVPIDPDDGESVAQLTESVVVDSTPHPGEQTGYAVFASRNATNWSRAATTVVTAVPPVTAVTVDTGPDRVTVSWTPHPQMAYAVVERTLQADGSVVTISAGRGSAEDTAVTQGVRYSYAVTAVYAGKGAELRSASVTVEATPRGGAVPVEEVRVTPIAGSSGSRVRVEWRTSDPTADVRIRRAEHLPPGRSGEELAVAEVNAYGEELNGERKDNGAWQALDASVPPGVFVLVPFSFGARGVLVGPHAVVGRTAPVRQLEARRHDEHAVLSWVWPDAAGGAEVRWFNARGPAGAREITRAQYVDENGCTIKLTAGEFTVEVYSTVLSPLGTLRSEAATVALRDHPARVRYRLGRPRGLRGWTARSRRTLTITADDQCAGLDLVLVALPGTVMPLRPDQGVEVARYTGLAVAAHTSQSFEIEVPGTVRRPYWLRCFALAPAGTRLTDPPVPEMKVS